MSMKISFYANNSEKNKLNKVLTELSTLEGNLRDGSSIIDPIVTIAATNPYTYNYAYIPEFGRYYFITDIISVRTGIWQIKMHVDVLMSFKEKLNSAKIVLSDSTSEGAVNYVSGDQWFTNVKNTTNIIEFPKMLNDEGEFILITAGG